MVKILDCTTRDGGHITNWCFEEGFVKNLLKELNQNAVSYFEIGYRNHYETEGKGDFYRCNSDFLQKYYKIKENLEIGVMTDITRFDEKDFKGVEQDYTDFIRIATHPDKISQALHAAQNLHQKGYKIFIQLMDITNIELEGYISLMNFKQKDIFESIYLADSYGKLQPNDVKLYFNKLKSLGYKRISFHAHNSSGNALANTLEAIKAGAYSVDTTKDGIGRNGGNLSSSELLKNL